MINKTEGMTKAYQKAEKGRVTIDCGKKKKYSCLPWKISYLFRQAGTGEFQKAGFQAMNRILIKGY